MGGDPFYPFEKLVYSIDIAIIILISILFYLRWGKKASLIVTSALAAVLITFFNNQVIHRIIRGYSGGFSFVEYFMIFFITLGISGVVFGIGEIITRMMRKECRNYLVKNKSDLMTKEEAGDEDSDRSSVGAVGGYIIM